MLISEENRVIIEDYITSENKSKLAASNPGSPSDKQIDWFQMYASRQFKFRDDALLAERIRK